MSQQEKQSIRKIILYVIIAAWEIPGPWNRRLHGIYHSLFLLFTPFTCASATHQNVFCKRANGQVCRGEKEGRVHVHKLLFLFTLTTLSGIPWMPLREHCLPVWMIHVVQIKTANRHRVLPQIWTSGVLDGKCLFFRSCVIYLSTAVNVLSK